MYQSLSLSTLGTLFCGLLFVWYGQTPKPTKNGTPDLSDYPISATQHVFYCDTIAIPNRNVPIYSIALSVLNNKLSAATTGTDSIDIITDFVYRIFPMAGSASDEFPGYALWKELTFEEMYAYAYLPESGIYCGNRTIALRKLLYMYGFKDAIEISYQNLHTFLLVRTNKDKLQIADAWSPYHFLHRNTRVDFIDYLAYTREGSDSLETTKSRRTFGVPISLLPDSLSTLIENATRQCGKLDSLLGKYQSMIPTYNNTEPQISRFFGYINTGKGVKYIITKDDGNWLKREAKALGLDMSEVWSNKEVSVNYSIPEYTDQPWSTATIHIIDSLRDLPGIKN